MAYPVTLNGRTYTLADFEGTNYVDGLPDAFEDFVTHAGNTYQTTSTTSIALGTGTLVFTVADSGKPYASGTPLRISNQADETDYIDALVTSYSGTTLTVNAVGYSGTGTIAAWNINIGGGPITVAGTLPVSQGGTGATTAAAAATALGLGTGDTPTFAGLNVTGTANFGDVNITNVGDIALDTISSDAGTSVTVNLGSDAGDDFIVGSNYLVVEGDTGNVGIRTASPSTTLDLVGNWVSNTGQLSIDTPSGETYSGLAILNNGTPKGFLYHDNSAGTLDLQTFTTDALRFKTNNTERLRIDSSGNVMIGTTSSSVPFYVYNTGFTGGQGTANTYTVAQVQTSTNTSGLWFGGMSTETTAVIGTTTGSGNLAFQTYNGSSWGERMRIDSSGNVGIGTSPGNRLHVQGSGDISRFTNGTVSLFGYSDSQGLGWFTAAGASGTGVYYNNTSSVQAFYTNSTEKMRLDSLGNLRIGTTAAQVTATEKVSIVGGLGIQKTDDYPLGLVRGNSYGQIAAFFNYSGTLVGSIDVAASSTSYVTSSDYRLKENITDADDAGSKIDAIQVRQFDWIADGFHQDYGMVAQELQTVAPEAVSGNPDSDEMMGVDYSKLVPMLIKEVQSLRARVAELENN